MSELTYQKLHETLHYYPETGDFVNKTSRSSTAQKNEIAGSINIEGYRIIKIDGKPYKASRLAHLYMEGCWPEYYMDHKNRIRHDDRWCNLRHVSYQCNARNCSVRKDNISGVTGVCWYKPSKKWKSQIMANNKIIYIGMFKDKTKAIKARWEAEKKYGFPNCNTTSTAYLYLKERCLI